MIPNFDDIALIIIDIQERLVNAMPPEVVKGVVASADLLAELVLELGGRVVYTEQYPKGLGSTVPVLAERLQGHPRYEKISFSCLGDERFMDEVVPELPNDVIVIGMEAHVCVLQTVLDLAGESYSEESDRAVFVPIDAICSRKKLHWENALDQMAEAGATITNTETLVFQALGEAGSDTFKKYSKRVRDL